MCEGRQAFSALLNQKEFLTAHLASSFVYLATYIQFHLSVNKRRRQTDTHTDTHTILLLKTTEMEFGWMCPQQYRLSDHDY